MRIALAGVHKCFGEFPALGGIDLAIASGQLLAVLGPSGAGKTTLLRVLAGLEKPEAGSVRFGDRDAATLSLRERRVGLVSQHYALFPHLSVFENVAFGLRTRPRRERPAGEELRRRVDDLLQRVQIADLRDRLPSQISGGQMQRVALARALAIEPSVLLFDEPFGALDAKVRRELRGWLRQMHDQTGYTTVLVTHDQEEALELADRVVVLRAGRIEQDGSPDEVYSNPANAFVFDFLGRSNRLSGQVRKSCFHPDGSAITLPCAGVADGPACLYARPHDTVMTSAAGMSAQVVFAQHRAGRLVLTLALPQQIDRLEVDIGTRDATTVPAIGETVCVLPTRYRVFADRT
ncbi:MAG: sulfate/molybdate ABC transporter ATP-binding protein [Proteobacteria bacterium]|nr:sulfate/molybdate ABC transporter ATP-binding protein [Pseudomonadota bacterium]